MIRQRGVGEWLFAGIVLKRGKWCCFRSAGWVTKEEKEERNSLAMGLNRKVFQKKTIDVKAVTVEESGTAHAVVAHRLPC